MPTRRARFAAFVLLSGIGLGVAGSFAADAIKPIARRLPPMSDVKLDPADVQAIETELAKVQARITAVEAKPVDEKIRQADLLADVKIYEKAVRYALLHGEFYGAKKPVPKPAAPKAAAPKPAAPAKPQPPRGVGIAMDLLKSANQRLDELEQGKHSWTVQKGAFVRGYTSAVDGSAQPYGLEIPDDVDFSKPAPLYIWLHGRGDNDTDLYFIKGREGRKADSPIKGAIVLHPFGRQCVGFKSAGEVDVLDAVESVRRRYKIDENRIVLAGFSMGGAGTWLLGAHYADRWAVVQPGAGYVDVKRYQNIDPATAPPAEQTLWGLNDVPDYAQNLFNVPVLSYSGENDKQRASARLMAEVYKENGHELPQFIGPKVEHKYLPLPDLIARLNEAVKKGRDPSPKEVHLQTRTLRYNKMFWVEATGLGEHWVDARIDAKVKDDGSIEVTTKNVTSFKLTAPLGAPANEMLPGDAAAKIAIDGQPAHPGTLKREYADTSGAKFDGTLKSATVSRLKGSWIHFVKESGGGWGTYLIEPFDRQQPPKRSGLQGPIDDAFVTPFLFVLPTGKSASPAVQAWVDFESKHQQDRWRQLMRGDARVKKDTEVTPEDVKAYNLVCWGDAASNAVIARMADKLPATWAGGKLAFGGQTYDAATHIPAVIFPNPLNPAKYVVLNSGLTFREAHDGTNSQQNPKLGDWAIIDITTPPSASAPGNVVANGFFDEDWKAKPAVKPASK